eukprot:8118374-Pyramimonas_sp.AAC.1
MDGAGMSANRAGDGDETQGGGSATYWGLVARGERPREREVEEASRGGRGGGRGASGARIGLKRKMREGILNI